MVQSTKYIKYFLFRFFLLLSALIISIWLADPFEIFLKTTLDYKGSGGFFGFDISSAILAVIMSWLFLGSILLSYLGRKADYVLSGILFLFSLFLFSRSGEISQQIYMSLIPLSLLGNAIGYGLKLLRQKVL